MSERFKYHFQRFEFKYTLPVRMADYLIPEVNKFMDADPFVQKSPGMRYRVNSLYLDSHGLDCYWQKKAGVRTRKKLRIRWYGTFPTPQSDVFLEIKKKYDTVVVKDRVAIPMTSLHNALFQWRPSMPEIKGDDDIWHEFIWILRYNGMVPQVVVYYDRMPYIGRADPGFRLTLDTQIYCMRTSFPGEASQVWPVLQDHAIIEVKFNNTLPFWFLQIIEKFSLEQTAYSKYCNSIELSRPEFDHAALRDNYQNFFSLL